MQRKINYKGDRSPLSRDELQEEPVFTRAAEDMLTCCLDQCFAPLFVSGPSCFGLADLANCCGDKVKAANSLKGQLSFTLSSLQTFLRFLVKTANLNNRSPREALNLIIHHRSPRKGHICILINARRPLVKNRPCECEDVSLSWHGSLPRWQLLSVTQH